MFFSVFNITPIENKVNDKYKTKKIKKDVNVVFLARINQTRANINSRRNLRLTETRLCNVWLSGSLVWPLKKTKRVIIAITENDNDKIIISRKITLRLPVEEIKHPVPINRIFNSKSNKIYL